MTDELLRYVEQHSDSESDYLNRLERASNIHLINGRMCSGRLQGRLLKMLVTMIRPRKVLELGTFTGYSALCMAEGLEDGAYIDTVEVDDELEDFIREALEGSPVGSRIRLHIGDALAFAASMPSETYDLIFIDADKRRYSDYYEQCLRILTPGGYIIADNTLWDGHVVNPAKEKDPQTAGIKAFNRLVSNDPRVEKVIVPVRDGLTLIRKLKGPLTR